MDLSSVSTDVGYDLDFNGTKKDFTYRGAYSGEGTNPGWPLGDGSKDGGTAADGGASDGGGGSGSSSGGSGGGGSSGSSSSGSGGGGADGGPNQEGPAGTGSSKGCGCTQAGAAGSRAWGAILGMAVAVAGLRRAQRRRG